MGYTCASWRGRATPPGTFWCALSRKGCGVLIARAGAGHLVLSLLSLKCVRPPCQTDTHMYRVLLKTVEIPGAPFLHKNIKTGCCQKPTKSIGGEHWQHKITDQELVFLLYKELFRTAGMGDQTPARKRGQDADRQVTKIQDRKMALKPLKSCSGFL